MHRKNGKDYVNSESLISFFLVVPRCRIFLKQALVVFNLLTFEHTKDAERSIEKFNVCLACKTRVLHKK